MSALKRITRWSYSLWKTYNTCPRKVKFSRIDGIKEPGSAAMDRGNAIHQEAEDFIRFGQPMSKLPDSCKLYEKEFAKLTKAGAVPEQEVAVNRNWEPVDYNSRDAWVRAKIDVYFKKKGHSGQVAMTIIDYKTGKVYEENKKQLSFYALLGFIFHPEVDTINVELWYLDQGPAHTHKDCYVREEFEDMKQAWTAAPAQLLHDTIFAPRPGIQCKRCFYTKTKNGNCEF